MENLRLPAILSLPAAVALLTASSDILKSVRSPEICVIFIAVTCSSCACKKPSGEPATFISSWRPEGPFDTTARIESLLVIYLMR